MAAADDVAIHLGRPLTGSESEQVALWSRWIQADIEQHAARHGLQLNTLDYDAVTRFTVAAIAHWINNPRRATKISVGVDDGRVGLDLPDGGMTYLPEWWGWLGLPAPDPVGITGWSGSIPHRR